MVSQDPVISQAWKYNSASKHPLVVNVAVFSVPPAEILELAGNAARDNKKGRVTPRHILLAIANDEELNQVSYCTSPSLVVHFDTCMFHSRGSAGPSCLLSPPLAPKRCDHCSGRSPAQHPPGAAGQEEGSKGETGDSRIACSREEAQSSQENGGQEDEWEKGRRKGQGAALTSD